MCKLSSDVGSLNTRQLVDNLKQGFGPRSSVWFSVLQVSILVATIAILFYFQIPFNGNYHLEVLKTFSFHFHTVSKSCFKIESSLITFKDCWLTLKVPFFYRRKFS